MRASELPFEGGTRLSKDAGKLRVPLSIDETFFAERASKRNLSRPAFVRRQLHSLFYLFSLFFIPFQLQFLLS